jgi:hypothetical protein
MNWKWTALASGAGLVATWLGTTAPPTRATTEVVPSTGREVVSPSANDIQEQAAHLQAAMRAHAEYTPPTRNPFVFPSRPQRRPIAPPAQVFAAVSPIAPGEPVRPLIRLTGIASDIVDGTLQRTAVLSTSSDVLLLREGESAAGYTVKKIDDDAVELVGPDASGMRLTLGNPKSQ